MPTPIPPEQMDALTDFIFRGQKIQAIALYRKLSGLGLKEAKDEVESLEASLRKDAPNKFTAAPKPGGCLGAAAVLCVCGALAAYWTIRK